MPLYDYKCTKCGTVREVRHGFSETHDEPCPACGAAMTRVFNPAPIVFKGSGFYATDSRAKSSQNDSKTDTKSETKPEAKTETKSEPSTGSGKGESAA
jgi:putative FmdB family regulatory protein